MTDQAKPKATDAELANHLRVLCAFVRLMAPDDAAMLTATDSQLRAALRLVRASAAVMAAIAGEPEVPRG